MLFWSPYVVAFMFVVVSCFLRSMCKPETLLSPDDFNFGVTTSFACLLLLLIDAPRVLQGPVAVNALFGRATVGAVACLSLVTAIFMTKLINTKPKEGVSRTPVAYWAPWGVSNFLGCICVVLTVWIKQP